MESPTFPLSKYKRVLYSVILIIWWVAIWGIADTVIHSVFKGATMKELLTYFSMIIFVLLIIIYNPEFMERL
jgi:hypothetical protein